MHLEILTPQQTELLSLVKLFKRNFYLVGGTAIALQIGHRRSIDFDLFTINNINHDLIKRKIFELKFRPVNRGFENTEQVHYNICGVKFTFYQYPFNIPHNIKFKEITAMPDLLELAAMKAFALGGRGKWKDYVDLYFIIKNHFTVKEVSKRAYELFDQQFNHKLFVQQLSFFKDISYEEEVDFLPGFEVNEEEIKEFLVNVATEPF
ncbi:MAG: nucleotidyl transferase AbiEii/AbiGii toxin family protein [Bacteroidia bacterium]